MAGDRESEEALGYEYDEEYLLDDDYEGYGGYEYTRLVQEKENLQIPGALPEQVLKSVDCTNFRMGEVNTGAWAKQGKPAIVIFHQGAWDEVARDTIQAFADIADQVKNLKGEIVACSADNLTSLSAWLKAPVNAGGFGGLLSGRLSSLWTDPGGCLASHFSLWCKQSGAILPATLLLDSQGVARHLFTSDLRPRELTDLAVNTLRGLKNCKLDSRDLKKPASTSVSASGGPSMRAMSPVRLNREDLEKVGEMKPSLKPVSWRHFLSLCMPCVQLEHKQHS